MRISPALTALLLGTAPALAAPQIVVDTQITASLVQQVTGDLAEIHVLLPAGASIHHHQMRPSDARALQGADLLIWTGPALTPWLDRAAESAGQSVAQLRLLDSKGTTLHDYEGQHSHAHDEDEGHEHDHDHDHDHGNIDPHAWLNPENAAVWLGAIAESLSSADPENAATYGDNAQAAANAIRDMDVTIRDELAPVADKSFVVFHDAYGYFTDHYGLAPALAVSPGDASTPSAARISELHSQIGDSGASCAFPEFAQDPKLIAAATQGTGVRLGQELDPEGAGIAPGPALYGQVIAGLAQHLHDCLSAD